MSYKEKPFEQDLKLRAGGVRFRAWSLTAVILVTLVFYLLVSVSFNQTINIIDILVIAAIQNMALAIWFPEGAAFGERNGRFISNRASYNKRASIIAIQQKTAKLREFCQVDFEERKQRYIEKVLGRISIEVAEFKILKEMSKDTFTIKKRNFWQWLKGTQKPKAEAIVIIPKTNDNEGKVILLNDMQKEELKKIIFKPIKIEMNNPDVIMSGLDIDEAYAIKNAEIMYRRKVFFLKAMQSIFVAILIAYIGYTLKDGVGLTEIVRIFVYVTALLFTIIMAFSQGEESIKTHKNNFLLQLINFLDRFFEYANIEAVKNEQITNEQKEG